MIAIAATLTDEQREALGYTLEDLVQTCTINENPCDMENDFTQIYDVDYGFCYTFNYKYPEITYNTTRVGNIDGLRMLVMSDIVEYLSTSSSQGIKVVLHPQDVYPFPNVDGFKSPTGKLMSLKLNMVCL